MFNRRMAVLIVVVLVTMLSTFAFAEQVFRVLIASPKDVSEARLLVSSLRQKGFFPEIVQEGELQNVYLGRFNSQEEAMNLRARMMSDGFAFAKVVNLDTAAAAAAPPESTPKESSAKPNLPANVLDSPAWKSLTPKQKEEVLTIMSKQLAMRSGSESTAAIMELKQRVDALDEQQKKIVVDISEKRDEEAKRQREIRRLNSQINRMQDSGDYEGAMKLLDDLEKLDPGSPIAGIKKERLSHLLNKTIADLPAIEKREREKMKIQIDRAADLAKSSNLDDLRYALSILRSISADQSAGAELKESADKIVKDVDKKIADLDRKKTEEAKAAQRKEQMMVWCVVGGVAGGFVLIVILVYVAGRRHYARMMRQLQDEAIAPLQELREKTRLISAGGAPGLSFDRPAHDMLEQSVAPNSEFLIPDSPLPVATGFEQEHKPAPQDFQDAFGTMDPVFDDKELISPNLVTPTSEPAPTLGHSDDGFMMDFSTSSKKEEDSSPAKSEATTPAEPEELVFSFDDSHVETPVAANQTNAPINAVELPATEEKPASGILFTFDDSVSDLNLQMDQTSAPGITSPAFSAPPQPTAPSSPQKEDSLYESIPLGNTDANAPLDLNFGFQDQTAPSLSPLLDSGPNPFGDGLSLEVEQTLPPDTLTAAPDAGILEPGVYLKQNFASDAVGSMPGGWTGNPSDYASLRVIDAPDKPGMRCLEFNKLRGDGPTSFSCAIPDIQGKIKVEFDFRCDEKNKHLLGFYVEKDGDFRRSIHTVVQSTGPESPSHLRVFTRPTPYQLKSWRHIRYIVDLAAGLVDGYVDDQLIAEGIRMGTLTESLNTLSIRDNSETTGVLYVANLLIAKAEEGA